MGDLVYPLTAFFIKGFDMGNSDKKVIFSNILRSARNHIEYFFGRLKTKWATFTLKMNLILEILTIAVYVSFILHNYWQKNKLHPDEEVVKSEIKILKKNEENYKNYLEPIFSFDYVEGTITRKAIR